MDHISPPLMPIFFMIQLTRFIDFAHHCHIFICLHFLFYFYDPSIYLSIFSLSKIFFHNAMSLRDVSDHDSLSTDSFSLLSINYCYFLGKIAVSHCFLHSFEFGEVLLLDWLTTKARELEREEMDVCLSQKCICAKK